MLQDLWQFAKDVAAQNACSDADALGDVGLILQCPPVKWDYDATPVNSVTIATTGGDGVHFGLLDPAEPPDGCSPVVMTVPMAYGMFGSQNVILGRNLLDFLALGCVSGFFALEQLAYEREDTIAALEGGDPSVFGISDSAEKWLVGLREHLSLTPWLEVDNRLAMLQNDLAHRIQYSDEYRLLHDESPRRQLVITAAGTSKMELVRTIKRELSITSDEALGLIREGRMALAVGSELALKPLAEELRAIGVTFEYEDT